MKQWNKFLSPLKRRKEEENMEYNKVSGINRTTKIIVSVIKFIFNF